MEEDDHNLNEEVNEEEGDEEEDDDKEEDDDEDDDDDDAGDEDDDQEGAVQDLSSQIQEIEQFLENNPNVYEFHNKLISMLRAATVNCASPDDLERSFKQLRAARARMSQIYPLTEQLWLEWIEDERKLVGSSSIALERAEIDKLFKQATQDYLCPEVWFQWCSWQMEGTPAAGEAPELWYARVRGAFEDALAACGLHVTLGSNIWAAYREFETQLLHALEPEPGGALTDKLQKEIDKQSERIASIFKRQLGIPLHDVEQTRRDYLEFVSASTLDDALAKTYEQTQAKLEQLRPFEERISSSQTPHYDEFVAYVDWSIAKESSAPARTIHLFERAIVHNCLNPQMWLKYLDFVKTKFSGSNSQALQICERAVRNCPASADLWIQYLRFSEKNKSEHNIIKGIMERALVSGMENPADFLHLWKAYILYERRRIDWSEVDFEHPENAATKLAEEWRLLMERAIRFLNETFGSRGDADCSLLKYWARLEAHYTRDMPKAREIWQTILQSKSINNGNVWSEYFFLERAYGDSHHCRKLLQRAINSVTDNAERLFTVAISFEEEAGALSDLEDCEHRVAQRREVLGKRAADEEARSGGKKPQKGKGAGGKQQPLPQQQQQQRWQRGEDQRGSKPQQQQQSGRSNWRDNKTGSQQQSPASSGPPKRDERTSNAGAFKRPFGKQDASDAPPVKTSRASSETMASSAPESHPAQAEFMPPPPPPPQAASSSRPAPQKEVQRDDDCTIFVSNLSFSANESQIEGLFAKCGEVAQVRLMHKFNGQSKGYGFVQFKDKKSVEAALKMDREPLEGRPVFVKRSESEHSSSAQSSFNFATGLEKNKLFIRNLPLTVDKNALETIYKKYGKLIGARIVTYRDGKPKGLAYVDFESEADAANALAETNGLQVGDNRIEVAISNPPSRSQQLQQEQTRGGQPQQRGAGGIFHGMVRAAMKQRVDVPTGGAPDESSANTEAQTHEGSVPETPPSAPVSGSITSIAVASLLPRAVAQKQPAVGTTSTNRLTNEAFRKLLAPKK